MVCLWNEQNMKLVLMFKPIKHPAWLGKNSIRCVWYPGIGFPSVYYLNFNFDDSLKIEKEYNHRWRKIIKV